MFVGLCRLFVALIVFTLPVMLRRRTMCLCGVLVMLGGFRVGFQALCCTIIRAYVQAEA